MQNPFSKSDYSDEVQRVIELGWSTPKAKEVKDPSDDFQRENLVSFPKAAYETDPHNMDLDAFWAEIRAKEICKILTEFGVHCIWEIGSGDGSAAIPLTNMGVKVICVEPLAAGAEYTSKFGIETFCSTLEQLNLPEESINNIGIFDVLEHIDKTSDFLSSIHESLTETGKLILSVPMYMNLFSDFDESIGHYRRYSEALLTQQLKEAGFEVLKTKYLFSYLIVPAFLLRRLPYLMGRRSNYTKLHKDMNKHLSLARYFKILIRLLSKLEEKLNPSFGLSLLVIAKKVAKTNI